MLLGIIPIDSSSILDIMPFLDYSSPTIVCVLPLPVCPYIIIDALNPSMNLFTTGSAQESYTAYCELF